MSRAKPNSSDNPDFERTMAELEETVRRLEGGDLPLEQALTAFEKGIGLVRVLHTRLDAVQMRIDELTQAPDGSTTTTPLPGAADFDDEVEGDDDEGDNG